MVNVSKKEPFIHASAKVDIEAKIAEKGTFVSQIHVHMVPAQLEIILLSADVKMVGWENYVIV